MITTLDHFVLVCPDIDAGIADYSKLLGLAPAWKARGEGVATAVFSLGNTSVELMAPSGDSAVADKLREMTADGPKLTTLVYRSNDIEEDHHLSTRRGLAPSEISDGHSIHEATGGERRWRRYRIPDEKMAGTKSFILEPTSGDVEKAAHEAGCVTDLDHLVINTPNPERTVATYGARLGLHLALDRTAEQWNTRFLFFRLGGLTLEIINRLDQSADVDGPDSIWGLTWATDDLELAQKRLIAAGIEVREIRKGRKPGSRVFTVRNGTLNVPTLFIHHAKR